MDRYSKIEIKIETSYIHYNDQDDDDDDDDDE